MAAQSTTLRVLLVAPRYFPYIGGLETHVYEVGRRLVRAGVEVTVLTTDPSGTLPPAEVIEGAQVRRVRAWPPDKDYYFAPAIHRVITRARRRWDVIHCQGYHTLVPPLAMHAAWRAGIPYVVTFHSGGETSLIRQALRGGQRAALRPLLARAERLIGVSQFEVRFFRERLRLPAEKFVVIPNGAQHLPGPPPAQSQHADDALIVSVGRLERYKGHQRVLAALPHVLRQRPDARLLIVGHGPYEPALRGLARRLGVDEHVEIRGIPAGDAVGMACVLSRASVVTLLSEHEGQGLAALEALALHRPVLVATTSALQELVDQGLAVGVPLASSPERVAAALLEQVRAPRVPARVELPSWDSTCDQLLEVYHRAAGRASCAS